MFSPRPVLTHSLPAGLEEKRHWVQNLPYQDRKALALILSREFGLADNLPSYMPAPPCHLPTVVPLVPKPGTERHSTPKASPVVGMGPPTTGMGNLPPEGGTPPMPYYPSVTGEASAPLPAPKADPLGHCP